MWFSLSPSRFLRKKPFDLDKTQFCFIIFETFKFAAILSTICTILPLVWNELWCSFRNTWLQILLILSVLCKFSFVVHTKCRKGAFCMNYELQCKVYLQTEVKQARWVKPEFTCSWVLCDQQHRWTTRNRIFRFLKSHKKSGFIEKSLLSVGSDGKIQLLML